MQINNYVLAGLILVAAPNSYAGDVLTGDVALACEAILCLSTGSPPGECSPSLSRYFSIDYSDFSDTIKERINFLSLCPASNETPEMQALVNAIANGAGRCDAASLNATLVSYINFGMGGFGTGCISPDKPAYCAAYENHPYTDLSGGAHYLVNPVSSTFWPFNSMSGGSFGLSNIGIGGYSAPATCGHWVN